MKCTILLFVVVLAVILQTAVPAPPSKPAKPPKVRIYKATENPNCTKWCWKRHTAKEAKNKGCADCCEESWRRVSYAKNPTGYCLDDWWRLSSIKCQCTFQG